MMFDFKEIEEREKKEYENKIEHLENQVKHWKSLYEREVKKRPVVVKYANTNQEFDRIKSILKLHHDTKDLRFKKMIIEELYVAYGIRKQPTHELQRWWREQ